MDDYLFFLAIATLVASFGLFFSFVGTFYDINDINEGKLRPPSDFIQKVENAAVYCQWAEVLGWTTLFSVKFSFLFYFRALVNRLHKMEIFWWSTFVLFIPIAATVLSGSFIVCPHTTGPAILRRLNTVRAGVID